MFNDMRSLSCNQIQFNKKQKIKESESIKKN